jgi:hypothetical protein
LSLIPSKPFRQFYLFILFIGIIFPRLGSSQTYFSTVEIRQNLPKKWQIRFRPIAAPLPNGFRTEIMVGKVFSPNWRAFSYTQLDFLKGKYQTGVRIDYTKLFLNNKLTTQGQIRSFIGLSKDTKFEGIFIGDLHYRVIPKLSLGVRNFTLESPDEQRFFKVRKSFLGPSTWYYPNSKNLFLTYYGPNLMAKKSFLFMFVWFVTL